MHAAALQAAVDIVESSSEDEKQDNAALVAKLRELVDNMSLDCT